MRIAVNTRLLLDNKLEGVGWFTHEILRRIVLQHPEHEFIFFFDRPFHEKFIFAKNVTPVVLSPQARHPFLYYLWAEVAVPRALKKYKADVYYSPEGLGSLKTKIPTCITIHDLAYLHYPHFMDKLHRWHYAKYLPKYCAKARQIIAVSEYTKSDIVKYYGIEERKIQVAYNAAQDVYQPLDYAEKEKVMAAYTQGETYFLFTGALHPRKNIINLLKAFVQFKRRVRSSRMKLVIVGRMAWQYDEIVKAKALMPYKDGLSRKRNPG
jgi:glycosyltransferase involved in cell wall biosynthesis